MKSFLKKSFSLSVAVLMIFTLSITTFATNKHYCRGYGYNTNYYQYNVNLKNEWGSEKITVVNTCGVPLDVYIGGVYRGSLTKPNSEITVAYKAGGTKSVKIHPRKSGTHSFRIKTTGYNDTITKIR